MNWCMAQSNVILGYFPKGSIVVGAAAPVWKMGARPVLAAQAKPAGIMPGPPAS
jgi:hypothetical protein